MAEFVPPYFGSIGKTTKDLLKKPFEIKTELKTINKSENGVKLESSFGGETSWNGVLKGSCNVREKVDIEGEVKTVGELTGKVSSKTVVPGLEIALSGKSKNKEIKLDTKYAQPFYAVSGDITHLLTSTTPKITGSGMIGFDGLSVGVSGVIDPSDDNVIVDYNCGAEYSQDDLTVSLFTENQGGVITASYWQRLSGDCDLGVSLKMDPETGDEMKETQHVLTVASKYKLDAATNVAIKGNTSGIVCASIQHVLSNPNLKLVLGASFDATKSSNVLAADKFGISCTFGDF